MPNLYFLALELIVYALFVACAWHAGRQGGAVLWQLVAGVIFGVLLEMGTIQQLQAYHYGRFLLMAGEVPLSVGVAWGCIIYSARLFSDASSLPLAARPIFDGLLPRVNTDVQLVSLTTLTDYQGTDATGKPFTSTFDLKLPEYRTQELATRVVVKSGETVVMGGVLEREKGTFVESVPVLGNIPVLGVPFRRRTEVDRPRYLLVFVTATILTDSGEFLIYDEDKAKK